MTSSNDNDQDTNATTAMTTCMKSIAAVVPAGSDRVLPLLVTLAPNHKPQPDTLTTLTGSPKFPHGLNLRLSEQQMHRIYVQCTELWVLHLVLKPSILNPSTLDGLGFAAQAFL